KLAQRQARIYETPVTYHGRTYEEGKKIGMKDGFQALYIILKTGLTRDIYKDPAAKTLEALSSAPKFNKWMADTIRPFLGKKVLDVGAGIGNVTRFLLPGAESYVITGSTPDNTALLASRFQHRRNVEFATLDVTEHQGFEKYLGKVDSVVCL